MKTKGVYFSANDQVYSWTFAFLRSFRAFNPELQLYLIPFDEACEKVKSLANTYNFKVYENPQAFTKLEELGESYELGHSPYGKYWFRRYAAFCGPLDYFMYLDARQLVLDDLSPLFEPLMQHELDFIYYDKALNQVYEPGVLRQNFLKQKGASGFNSGRWIARKSLFTLDELLKLGYESLHFRDQLNPRNTDQAFINYCIDSKPEIKTAHIAEYFGNYLQQGWAGQRGKIYKKDNAFYLWDYGGLDHKKKVLLLHWAGFSWEDNVPQSKLLNAYSQPTFSVKIKRVKNGVKRKIKSWYFLRKLMQDV